MLEEICRKRRRVYKIENFFEYTTPLMSNRLFRRYYRMFPRTLNSISEFVANCNCLQEYELHSRIPLIKKIAMTCCYLGCTATTIQLAHLFGVAEETFLRVTNQVVDALIEKIHQVICWPQQNELQEYAAQFNTTGRFFPNTIGAIDDIHLEINLTEEKSNQRSYYCWKLFHSIHLQAVATYDLRFMDVFVGWPGRANDLRVFRNNPLYHTLPGRLKQRHAGRLIDTFHLVGDSAFQCSPQLLTPFKKPRNAELNAVQKKFNTHLSSKRNTVERSFALLLLRFPRTNKLNQFTLRKKIRLVLAACILHNICILEKDNIAYYLRRAALVPLRQLNNRYQPLGSVQSKQLGNLKRLQMATMIWEQ